MTIKKRTLLIVLLISAITIIALFASAWFYVSNKLSRLDSYKESIAKTVALKLNRDITYETVNASLTLRNGLSLQFINVVITEKDRSSSFLNVKKASVRVNIFPLLRNRFVFGEIILDQPRISLKRDSAGVLNIADLLVKKKDDNTLEFRKLIIENGMVTFLDQAASKEGLLTSLENLQCRINSPFWTKSSSFHITSSVIEDKNKAELSLDGSYRPAPSEKPVYESKVKASIHLKGTDLKHYNSYLKNYTPIEQMAGTLNADIKYSGRFSDFKSKGTVNVKNAQLNYPGVFRDNLQPRMIHADYAFKRDAESLQLDVGRLAIDKFEAKGRFGMDDLDKKDPLLKGSATTTIFALREIRSYIPWGIIPEGVGNFIDTHVKDGNFRLVEGKLKGRLSQLAHFNKKESIDVLSIRAEVNKGVFEAHITAPVFHDINGILELKKRQFSLKNMKGRFGLSPLTMEGNISDFSFYGPVAYTASMQIQPTRNEVLWLLGKEKFGDLGFNGSSTLLLSGKGPADNYHISALWNMANLNYVYPKVIEKQKGRPNQLSAEITLNEDAFNVSSFNYDLPPVNVTGSALFRYSGGIPLSFSIQSKAFDVREAVPILPVLRTFNPAGTCSLALAGRGDLDDPGSIQWKGTVSLANVSLKPSPNVKPLKGLTGNALFKGNSMETLLLKARIGESDIQGNFRIDDFRKPKVICQFNTNLLKTKDLGFQNPEVEVNFHDMKGQIAIEDKMIHVDNLSFGLGKSSFNLSGDVSDFALSKITVVLTSPYVSSEDLDRLISLKYPKKANDASSSMELNATLRVDAGKFNDVDFKQLHAGIKFTRGILDIETLEAGFFDGKFKAKGKVNIHPDGQNHYEANVSIHGMSLEVLQSYLEIGNRTVTGKLSLTGDLSATGRNADDFKKTVVGTFKVQAEKGVLKKFSVLSKIFSLLNVLQLAKLHLPDMKTDGMPYKMITSNMSVKNGILSSENFFIDSDSIQISGSGKVDFLKKKLDLIAGVHPLQSLDFIAAKIPIAGWLITDERGKLITAHFKVDGTWDDPKVTPVNAKSVGKGTLDIFRRIFQLPGKLITDTGEVILGH